MTSPDVKRARFEQLESICRALPETRSEAANGHTAFLVRTKKFAYHLDDHHGDGRVALCFRAPTSVNRELVADDPERFFVPPYIGPRGWAGLYLDLADVDWDEVADFVGDSYLLAAPRRLVALVVRQSR